MEVTQRAFLTRRKQFPGQSIIFGWYFKKSFLRSLCNLLFRRDSLLLKKFNLEAEKIRS